MNEIWKDIEGYEGKYQVSSFGRVRSVPETPSGGGDNNGGGNNGGGGGGNPGELEG